MSSDTKVYETFVTIDQEVERLKPGMTAVVEIHVDRLENVLCVPVQAIVQEEQQTWCYVDQDGLVQRRDLTLGRTNDTFVEVRKGLVENDLVVLNPSVLSEQESGTSESDGEGQLDDTLDEGGAESAPSAHPAQPVSSE